MEKTPQGGLRILFADDEAHLRELMQMELPRLGHEVTVCPDGIAAIRALAETAKLDMDEGKYAQAQVGLQKALRADRPNFGPEGMLEHPLQPVGIDGLDVVIEKQHDFTCGLRGG